MFCRRVLMMSTGIDAIVVARPLSMLAEKCRPMPSSCHPAVSWHRCKLCEWKRREESRSSTSSQDGFLELRVCCELYRVDDHRPHHRGRTPLPSALVNGPRDGSTWRDTHPPERGNTLLAGNASNGVEDVCVPAALGRGGPAVSRGEDTRTRRRQTCGQGQARWGCPRSQRRRLQTCLCVSLCQCSNQ
jgi:hypothetical protein